MNSRRIKFENEAGLTLDARLDLPADGEPIACALFAHCFTCSKDLKALTHISRALTGEGVAVLRFDFTGLGESEGDFSDTHFSSNVDDLVAAAAFMEREHEAPSILIGHSLGGAAVLIAAARLPSVKAVATIGAPCRPDHVKRLLTRSLDAIRERGEAVVQLAGRQFTIKQEFLDDLDEQNMRGVIQNLRRALLILHAPRDEVVDVENAADIFHHARHPKSFVSLDDADHLLTDASDALYAGSVIAAWASRYIGPSQRERKQRVKDSRIIVRTEAEGFRTEILANGHALTADEPVSAGGMDSGPTPYDLLVAGLGACTSMTLRMYAERKSWPLDAVTVRLRHQKVHAQDCADCENESSKMDKVEREIELEGALDAAQRSRLLEIADRCPVHRTLQNPVVIDTTLKEAVSPER